MWLIHLSLASYKKNIDKQFRSRSDAAERGVLSGSKLFAINTGITIKHGYNKYQPDSPYFGNAQVQIRRVHSA